MYFINSYNPSDHTVNLHTTADTFGAAFRVARSLSVSSAGQQAMIEDPEQPGDDRYWVFFKNGDVVSAGSGLVDAIHAQSTVA